MKRTINVRNQCERRTRKEIKNSILFLLFSLLFILEIIIVLNNLSTTFFVAFIISQITLLLFFAKKITIKYDKSKPNGTPRKIMDISLANQYGWKSKTSLEDSILICYKAYLKQINL